MRLALVLEKARPALANRWAEAANAVYPFAATGFLRTRQDPFANPVGQRSRELAEVLLAAVLGAPHSGQALRAALEEFVRVRAMQDLPPETSLQVMFAYKDIIRDYLKEHTVSQDDALREDLRAMDERCDTLALLAFGGYSRARETFHDARIEDVRRRHSQVMRLAKRHGLIVSDDGFDGLCNEDSAGSSADGNPAGNAGLP
ncbi:RsbRD N-terminal domain-containing protein [Desulfovibrio sp. OttesenSCG-928-O18]|nr:RsbRD N-terminal domain-containing protein [Desulfovibrio sp. OttesenSCG-928-O18]